MENLPSEGPGFLTSTLEVCGWLGAQVFHFCLSLCHGMLRHGIYVGRIRAL